ncbi:peptidase inhibitor family I36 protein [Streptomyces sp. NRRL F-5193]|uniref:peptidase inhibitor family I36 protein n=1 Tax=Streptomyces sp. NRRL F-5193 TaxID=1463860 RepID=UPI00099D2728|nr:peptidase inhibitor family I36 protein [Streptomyces sp. NRRL F-5193]
MKAMRLAAAAASVAIVGGFAIATSTAVAAPATCGSGYVCLYEDDDYKGGGVYWNKRNAGQNLGGTLGFNDSTNSWYNNSNVDAKWFYDANFQGSSRCMNSYSSNHSLSIDDYDEASSEYMYGNQTTC